MPKLQELTRDFSIPADALDTESRTVTLTFSSEEPVDRGAYIEILSHKSGAADLTRLHSGAPLLVQHDHSDQIGVVLDAGISNGRGAARVKFGQSDRAREVMNDVSDDVRNAVSFGYQILEYTEEPGADKPTIRATKWQATEISIVSVPADISVGIGRSIQIQSKNKRTMSTTAIKTGSPATSELERERLRVSEIRAVTDGILRDSTDATHIRSVNERADKAIGENWPVEAFQSYAVDAMRSQGVNVGHQAKDTTLGVGQRDLANYSFVRFLDGLATDRLDGLELELSREWEIKTKTKATGGFLPPDVLAYQARGGDPYFEAAARSFTGNTGRRDLLAGTDSAGGYTVQTDVLAGSFIDLLRSKTLVLSMGATELNNLQGDVSIPKLLTEPAGNWVGEVATATEETATFGQVTMTPTTITADMELSKQLLAQSSMDVEGLARRILAGVIGSQISGMAINGLGSSDQPTGVRNTAGVTTVALGTDGLAPTYADMVELEGTIEIADGDSGTIGYYTNASVKKKLKTTLESATSGANFVFSEGTEPGFGMVNGHRCGVSNQVPNNLTKGSGTDLSSIIAGVWSELYVGTWGGLDIVADAITKKRERIIGFTAHQFVDIAVGHAESFAIIEDAITV